VERPAVGQRFTLPPEPAPTDPWSQRLGTVGVVLLAVLAGVVAYSLSFLIRF
jgi:hypothetical protein